MAKKTRTTLFSFICCILLFSCGRAYAAVGDDFIKDVLQHAASAVTGEGDFQTTRSPSWRIVMNNQQATKEDMRYTSVFRSKKTVVVFGTREDGGKDNPNPQDNKNPYDLALFKTKDPALVFAGSIAVGGSLKKALQSKKLRTPDEKDSIEGGTHYTWHLSDAQGTALSMILGMTVKGDVIQEIDFFDEMVSVGIDAVGKEWEKAEYLEAKPNVASSVRAFQNEVVEIMLSISGSGSMKPAYATDDENISHSKKTVLALANDGGDYTPYYLQTRDPSLVFPGKIKVGGSLKAATSSGKIPGKRQKVKKTSSGLDAHTWSTKGYDFTLRCKGDTIQEILYHDREVNQNIDRKRMQYAK